jgi:hypothetical protein
MIESANYAEVHKSPKATSARQSTNTHAHSCTLNQLTDITTGRAFAGMGL